MTQFSFDFESATVHLWTYETDDDAALSFLKSMSFPDEELELVLSGEPLGVEVLFVRNLPSFVRDPWTVRWEPPRTRTYTSEDVV